MKHERFLANDLAITAPDKFFTQFGMGIARAYHNAHVNTQDDPDVLFADFKGQRGQRRFAYCNRELDRLAESEEFKGKLHSKPVCMGEKNDGSNNHIEVRFGNYLLTHHHVTNISELPSGAKYVNDNNGINSKIDQMELFQEFVIPAEPSPDPSLYVMALHTENSENGAEVDMIHFVFPKDGKRLAFFEIDDLVELQSRIEMMSHSELAELRFHHEQERKRRSNLS